MKYWVTTVLMTVFASQIGLLQAQSVAFEQSNWQAVLKKAKTTGKPIFVDTYASWCEPCKWMDQHVFAESSVGDFLNQNYISYKLNVERGEGLDFAQRYRVTSYPTLLYFDNEGQLVHRIVGAPDAPNLIQESKAALDPDHQIYTLQERYENGNRDPDFLARYTEALTKVYEPHAAVATAYLEAIGVEALGQSEHFAFLERFVTTDYKHPTYVYVLEHRAAFAEQLGDQRVERYLEAPLKLRCYELVDHAEPKASIRAFLQDVKTMMPDRIDYFKSRLEFYANRGNERKQYRLAQKYEKHCRDAESLSAIARQMLQVYGDSPVQLNSALEWVDRALVMEESIYALETKALLFLALDRREEAREVAERQLVLSTDKGKYIMETKALLKRING